MPQLHRQRPGRRQYCRDGPCAIAASATRICIEIALGKSLIGICSADDLPDRVTVYRWLEEHVEFRNEYARARRLQADHFADQIVDLADAAEDYNKARLQIDARKWTAAKLRPNRYGERVVNELTGKDGTPLSGLGELTDEDRARIRREFADLMGTCMPDDENSGQG